MSGVDRWSLDELAVFLASVRDARLEAAWHLVALAGLRTGELLALRWSDLDLDEPCVRVRNAIVGVPYAAIQPSPMSRQARVIEIDPNLAKLLNEHRERQQAERSEWDAYDGDHDLVVCAENGRPLHPRALSRAFAGAIERAGLRPIRVSALARAGRTHSLPRGAPA